MQVFINDGANWAVNNLTVDPQGATIESLSAGTNLVLSTGGLNAHFIFNGTKWKVYSQASALIGGATSPLYAPDMHYLLNL